MYVCVFNNTEPTKASERLFWQNFQVYLVLIVLWLAIGMVVTKLNDGECKSNQCMNDTNLCNEQPFIYITYRKGSEWMCKVDKQGKTCVIKHVNYSIFLLLV